MFTKRKILILSILTILLILISSFAYAEISEYQSNISKEEETKVAIANKVNSVLTALNCSPTLNFSNVKLNTTNDKYRNVEYYTVNSNKYQICIDSSTNSLSRIKINNYDFNRTAKSTKDEAQSFISTLYNNLGLPAEYELMYLEPFSKDTLWEADFQKSYDGTYNMYEAVKVIFDPAAEEVVALTVFNEEFDNERQIETEIEDPDRSAGNELFSSSLEDGESVDITFIKPSVLKENNLKDDTIRKAYVVKKVTGNRVTKTYFDFYNNVYLGGDILR